MNIFVINSGSSSLKYQLIEMPAAKTICSGIVDRIGLGSSLIKYEAFINGEEVAVKKTMDLSSHEEALAEITSLLTDVKVGVIKNTNDITAVGHRVVHGGEQFAVTTIITPAVKEQIKKLFPLAPLHNPANYMGIEVAEKIFPSAKQIAVFDTAFHQTMPEKTYRYAIPNELYLTHSIRAYGFHGTSHKYVSEKALEYLQNPKAKIAVVHLGNGCSISAVENGKCVDTSMGLGPMNGLIMGTRCGDIDQSVIFHMINQLGYDAEQVNTILNKKSGMQGLTGMSDMRDITNAMNAGDKNAKLAYEMYAYRIRKYIGSYAAILNGLDAVVFTAGVGENDEIVRRMVCENMEFFGIKLDNTLNDIRSKKIREINTPDSKTKVLVIPTNEELEIAKQCKHLLN